MKAEVRLCFCNSYRLQGWRKLVIGFMQWTEHTHVHIELRFNTYKLVLLTLDGAVPRIIRLGLNNNLFNVEPSTQISLGVLNLNEDLTHFVLTRPVTNRWKLIGYQIQRYFGIEDKNNIPFTCSVFVSEFANLHHKNIPRFFSPKQLWRYLYDDNYDWR